MTRFQATLTPPAPRRATPQRRCRISSPLATSNKQLATSFPVGFTTIELLVALGILVILAGMVFWGFKAVTIGGRIRATRSTLETARSMMNEAEIHKGLPAIKSIYRNPPGTNVYYYYFAFPSLPASAPAQPSGAKNAPPTPPVPTPLDARLNTTTSKGNVSEDLFDASTNNVRFESDAVIRTQMVMQRLTSFSLNRTTLAQLPARSFLTWDSSTAPPTGAAGTVLQIPQTQISPARYAPNPPLLVDAWNNPIIYVPPAGLSNVHFKDDPTAATVHVVTSVRVRGDYTSGVTDPRNVNYYNFEPGATGFWASAGPDGDFTTGDDNIYSFEGF